MLEVNNELQADTNLCDKNILNQDGVVGQQTINTLKVTNNLNMDNREHFSLLHSVTIPKDDYNIVFGLDISNGGKLRTQN